MTPTDIAALRTMVTDSQTAPWPVAAVRAKAALAAAMEAHGEALLDLAQRALELPPDRPVGQLCADAEYGRGRRQRQAGYARRHEAKRRQAEPFKRAQQLILQCLPDITETYIRSGEVTLVFSSIRASQDFKVALTILRDVIELQAAAE